MDKNIQYFGVVLAHEGKCMVLGCIGLNKNDAMESNADYIKLLEIAATCPENKCRIECKPFEDEPPSGATAEDMLEYCSVDFPEYLPCSAEFMDSED